MSHHKGIELVTKELTKTSLSKTQTLNPPKPRRPWSLAIPAALAVTASFSIPLSAKFGFNWSNKSQQASSNSANQINSPTINAQPGSSVTYQSVAGPLLPPLAPPAQMPKQKPATPRVVVSLGSRSGLKDIGIVAPAGTIGILNQDTEGATMENVLVTGPTVGIANIRAKNTLMKNMEVRSNNP